MNGGRGKVRSCASAVRRDRRARCQTGNVCAKWIRHRSTGTISEQCRRSVLLAIRKGTRGERKRIAYLALVLPTIAFQDRVSAVCDELAKLLHLMALPVVDPCQQVLHLLVLLHLLDGRIGSLKHGLHGPSALFEVVDLVRRVVASLAEFLLTVSAGLDVTVQRRDLTSRSSGYFDSR